MLSPARRLAFIAGLLVLVLLPGCQSGEEMSPSPGGGTSTVMPGGSASPAPVPVSQTPVLSPVPIPPGYTKYRWGEITFVAANDIQVARYVGTSEENPPDGGPLVHLILPESSVIIDAESGRVLSQTQIVTESLKNALASVRAGEPVEDPAPWPLGDSRPPSSRVDDYSVRYFEPHPASGIALIRVCPLSIVHEDGECAVGITNGRSTWSIYGSNGQLGHNVIAPEDAAAFDRWIASVERATE